MIIFETLSITAYVEMMSITLMGLLSFTSACSNIPPNEFLFNSRKHFGVNSRILILTILIGCVFSVLVSTQCLCLLLLPVTIKLRTICSFRIQNTELIFCDGKTLLRSG